MPDKKQSILIGTLIAGILSTSYLGFINLLCCAGVIAGAVVAVWHYGKTYGIAVPTKDAIVMGVLVAIFASILSGILNYVLAMVGIRADLAIQQMMVDMFGANMPAEDLAELEDQMSRPVTIGTYFGAQFFIGLVFVSIFGAIGGAIGRALTSKNAPATETTL